MSIPIDLIDPSPYQMRRGFPDAKIRKLANSLKTRGLSDPILVRPIAGRYQLVSGDCRTRAAKLLEWTEILARVQEMSDSEAHERAIIENESPTSTNILEKATGYLSLTEPPESRTPEQIGILVGKDQSTIYRTIALLKHPGEIQKMLEEEQLTERHARELSKIADFNARIRLAHRILEKGLSTEETEREVEETLRQSRPKRKLQKGKSKKEAKFVEYSGVRLLWKDPEEVVYTGSFKWKKDVTRQIGKNVTSAIESFLSQVPPPGQTATVVELAAKEMASLQQGADPPAKPAANSEPPASPPTPSSPDNDMPPAPPESVPDLQSLFTQTMTVLDDAMKRKSSSPKPDAETKQKEREPSKK